MSWGRRLRRLCRSPVDACEDARMSLKVARVRTRSTIAVFLTFATFMFLTRSPVDMVLQQYYSSDVSFATRMLVSQQSSSYEAYHESFLSSSNLTQANTQPGGLGNKTSSGTEQELRRKRMAEVCRNHSGLWQSERPWQYKVSHARGLIYCPIPKAGWSSWKRVLFFINGAIKSPETEIGVASDSTAGILDMSLPGVLYLQSLKFESLRQYTFTFVRDPWSRLVSAYINKALDWNYTRIMHTPCGWESLTPYRNPINFTQFLTCIVEKKGFPNSLDMHWTPMWRLCDFCRIHYDYVGHIETADEDARRVLEANHFNVSFPKVFSSKAHNTTDVTKEWYKAVPLNVIKDLQMLYHYDFLLHGYSKIPPGWEERLGD